jgi:sugar/nucleoside kinase (ribokinase family)
MQPLGVIGSVSRDLVDAAPARAGGAVLYAARAFRLLGCRAVVSTKCAGEDRDELLPALVALGLPVSWRPAGATTTFSFSYDGDVRTMRVEAVGEPWTAGEHGGLAGVRWLHVGALLRSDFSPDALESLGRRRILSLDGQALVRPGRVGPLELDGDFDPKLLTHVRILKLSEDEARAAAGEVTLERIRELGVPEVVVTRGSHGCIVFAEGRAERLCVEPVVGADPTGAGDSFAAAYLAARRSGDRPVGAARRACALVSALLRGQAR